MHFKNRYDHNPLARVSLSLSYLLAPLITDAKTASPIESAVHGITWVHHLVGERSPLAQLLVKDVLAGAQRPLADHTSKKEPIKVSQLEP